MELKGQASPRVNTQEDSQNLKSDRSYLTTLASPDVRSSYDTRRSQNSPLKSSFLSISPKVSFKEDLAMRLSQRFEEIQNRKPELNQRLRLEIPSKPFIPLDSIKPAQEITESYELRMKDEPGLKWCPYCAAEVCTEVTYVSSPMTFWSSLGIFLMGGVCGCFMLPYASKSCKSIKIRCHRCKRTLS